MLKQALQRILGRAPTLARWAYSVMPESLRREVEPVVASVTESAPSAGLRLDVPDGPPRRADVVVAPDGGVRASLADSLKARGHRVWELDAREVSEQARGLVDPVLIPGSRRVDREVLRFAWRIARGELESPDDVYAAFPTVSVIVAASGDEADLLACLRGLMRNTGWPSLEIVVVVDGVHERGRLKRYERVNVIENPKNVGLARALNQGILGSSGAVVVLMTDECVVGPGWLSRLVAHLERDPKLGLVSPATNQLANGQIDVCYEKLEQMEALAHERGSSHASELCELDRASSFCAGLRRTTLESIGLVDERYELGPFEAHDLSLALRERGLRLGVAQDAFVHRVERPRPASLSDAAYQAAFAANRRRFEQKWGRRWTPPRP